MTDTQNYARDKYLPIFSSMRDWILEHREERNIVFLAHSGDVVDSAVHAEMEKNASDMLVPVFQQIPGAICCGNHDIVDLNRRYELFFPRAYVQATLQNDDFFGEGDHERECYYSYFSAGGDDFIVFSIGYKVPPECFDWAKRVMDEHPGAVAIFLTHFGIENEKRIVGPGKHFLKLSQNGYPQAKLMLCGHMRGNAFYRDPTRENGSVIMMFNYQDDMKYGVGFMRLLTFDPADRSIEVVTYSPYLDQVCYSRTDPEKDCFVIPNAY